MTLRTLCPVHGWRGVMENPCAECLGETFKPRSENDDEEAKEEEE